MPTYHLHIKGCVQGVGFRPFVYRLAKKYGLGGWVNNTSDGVHIRFTIDREQLDEFSKDCLSKAPSEARITDHQLLETELEEFDDFKIINSESAENIDLAITPDFGICSNCLQELETKEDRRFAYPFITCTHCGPRYSILEGLPYDRPQTSMEVFPQCETCQAEYDDPLDRRYYSQTNSCKDCGISLTLYDNQGKLDISQETIIEQVGRALVSGKIVAVKGIGGYLFLCDATQEKSIKLLRERKQRPDKPFAVMYSDLDMLKGDVELAKEEQEMLEGAVSPILLLPFKSTTASSFCRDLIAPSLAHLGVMLPYAPLFVLISKWFGKPLVATSANLSGSPVIFDDEKARGELFRFADFILSHNRKITTGQDDSVIRKTSVNNQQIILRRSRGLAPNFYGFSALTKETILCLGAQMKGSFCLATSSNLYVSQYLGNLESYEAQKNYERTLCHFLHLTQNQAERICVDAHPNYFATNYGEVLAEELKIPLYKVPHHEAHFAAVLGENQLLETKENILGIVWDGTGLGTDGQLWGGEFFDFDGEQFDRIAHLNPFPVLAGDKMAKEPRLSALSTTMGNDSLQHLFSPTEWSFYKKLVEREKLQTSSIGRLFDTVACLCGLVAKSSFEGQAALLTEPLALALSFFQNRSWKKTEGYPFQLMGRRISFKATLEAIISDLASGIGKEKVMGRFYQTLVNIIDHIASSKGYDRLAFSGGVFQNGVLVDLIMLQLGGNYRLYFHQQLSPNDENISFGQYVHYLIASRKSAHHPYSDQRNQSIKDQSLNQLEHEQK